MAEACAFVGNKAKLGGSIYGEGKITLFNTNITDSEATVTGGGCRCATGSICSFTNVLIKGNTAPDGGGVSLLKSTFHMLSSTVEANTATVRGGGVYIAYATASINETRFYKNEAQNGGGGIYMYGSIVHGPSVLTMSRSVLEENEQTSTGGNADFGGGGLYIQHNSSAVLRETSLIGNKAKADIAVSGNHGHQIMTHKANSAYTTSFGVTLINSRVENCIESFCNTSGNFYGYNDGGIGAVANYVGTETCTPTLCTSNGYTNPICMNQPDPNEGVVCFAGCEPGKYGPNVSACHSCPTGKYGTEAGKLLETEACWSCAEGTYNNRTGTTACHNRCPGGRYGNTTGARSMLEGCSTLCPLGKYGDFKGKTAQDDACPHTCEPGKYGSHAGQIFESECRTCPNGFYCSDGLKAPCPSSPKGKFGKQLDSSDLVEKSLESSACEDCPVARFGAIGGQTTMESGCLACPAGRYGNEPGQSNATGEPAV